MKRPIRVSWVPPPGYTAFQQYRVRVWDGSILVNTGSTFDTAYQTPDLPTGRLYIVWVSVFTGTTESTFAQASILLTSSASVPADVPSFQIVQWGAWLLFVWGAVEGARRYEIRRWGGGGSWDTGARVDLVDALSLRTNDEPAGVWTYGIAAIGAEGLASATPATVAFTVTPDSNTLLLGINTFASPTLTNVTGRTPRDGVIRYATDFGSSWGTLFGGSPMSSFANPVDSYQAAGTSTLETEWWDSGSLQPAHWAASIDLTDDSGTAVVEIDLSPDGSTGIVTTTGRDAFGVGRWVRVRAHTTGAMTIKGLPSITVSQNPKEETFAGTSSASAAVTITLLGHYFAARDIAIHPTGTSLRAGVWSSVSLDPTSPNTFDVEVFDSTNTKVAVDFLGTFKGLSY